MFPVAGHENIAIKILISLVILFGASIASPKSISAITVEVDRTSMHMGETLELKITGDASERLDRIDLAALETSWDWEILSSSSTSTSFVNGVRSTARTLTFQITPINETGVNFIPSFTDAAGNRTKRIKIWVGDRHKADDNSVRFSVEIDKRDVYVKEQIILTFTVDNNIAIEEGEVTGLELENAIVRKLSSGHSRRAMDGRAWWSTKHRYAIYPQHSGILEIPSLSLAAAEKKNSYLGPKRFRITEDAIAINVKPVPNTFLGSAWLPASSIELTQSWSREPESLMVGDSITRTFYLSAEGLLGEELPSIKSEITGEKIVGFKIASESFVIEEKELANGFKGNKARREVLLLDAPGEWLIPAIEVPWWNTETNSIEYAKLPAKLVSVSQPASASQSVGESRSGFDWESVLSKIKETIFPEPATTLPPPPLPQSDNGLGGKALQCFANTRADIGIDSTADDSTFWRFIGDGMVQDIIDISQATAEIKSKPVMLVLSQDAILLGQNWSLNRKTLRLTKKKTEKTQQCEIFYIQSEYFKQLNLIRDRIQLQTDARAKGNLI